jgi:hypothetical protein
MTFSAYKPTPARKMLTLHRAVLTARRCGDARARFGAKQDGSIAARVIAPSDPASGLVLGLGSYSPD